jgi:hypothetical protein
MIPTKAARGLGFLQRSIASKERDHDSRKDNVEGDNEEIPSRSGGTSRALVIGRNQCTNQRKG